MWTLNAAVWNGQKKVPDSLDRELQAVVRYPMWVLGAKLMFSGKAVSVLNH